MKRTDNSNTNSATLRMVSDIEGKSLAFVALCRDDSLPRDSFQGFRQFIDEVESFYLYVDVVDNRLPQLKLDKKHELHKHVSQIRWKVMALMVETSLIYLKNIQDSERPMPLGAAEFLQSRLNRTADVREHYLKFREAHGLTPLRQGIIEETEALISEILERCISLNVYETDNRGNMGGSPQFFARPDGQRDPLDNSAFGAWARALHNSEPLKLSMRSEWGRFFMASDATETIHNACKRANVSMDELAHQLSISRVALGLMIRGADAMPREIAAKLESFVEQA